MEKRYKQRQARPRKAKIGITEGRDPTENQNDSVQAEESKSSEEDTTHRWTKPTRTCSVITYTRTVLRKATRNTALTTAQQSASKGTVAIQHITPTTHSEH